MNIADVAPEAGKMEIDSRRFDLRNPRRPLLRSFKRVSAALIVAGNIPLQILYYRYYSVYTTIDILQVAALAYGAASALALVMLYFDRLVGSGVVAVVTGLLMFYALPELGLPMSLLPGTAVAAAGIVILVGNSYTTSYPRP